MTPRILFIDHHDNPRDDRASSHLATLGYASEWRVPANGDALGEVDSALAGCVLFGGMQNVDEMSRYPFLRDEVDWIHACHERRVPLLGICLGAQLIAHAFGAQVAPLPGGQCEFGYYPITPTAAGRDFLPAPMHAVQAHFHAFTLPPSATLLATGDGNGDGDSAQAFRCGETTYAVQFHPEVTRPIFRRWQDAEWAFFDSPGAQTRAQQDKLAAQHDARQHAWFVDFLTRLFAPGGANPVN